MSIHLSLPTLSLRRQPITISILKPAKFMHVRTAAHTW